MSWLLFCTEQSKEEEDIAQLMTYSKLRRKRSQNMNPFHMTIKIVVLQFDYLTQCIRNNICNSVLLSVANSTKSCPKFVQLMLSR